MKLIHLKCRKVCYIGSKHTVKGRRKDPVYTCVCSVCDGDAWTKGAVCPNKQNGATETDDVLIRDGLLGAEVGEVT